VEKDSRKNGEAQNSYNAFEFASPSPWIPMIPDSDKGPQLDKEWEENHYGLQSSRQHAS
jgi:hypothetical protein